MVQPAPDAEELPDIPRPPTPPRVSERSAAKQLVGHILSSAAPHTSLSSGVEPLVGTPTSSRKKVGFSEWTEYKDPPAESYFNANIPTAKRNPLPSSAEKKPIKSILKPYNGTIGHDLGLEAGLKFSPPYTFPNLAAMLESTVQQLAGRDRSSRIDAYTTLSGALRASDNVPEIRALKDKMGLLTQFIQRDLTARTLAGTPDTSLTVNALVLLSSFLQKTAVADLLNTEFSVAVIEHCIKTLEDPEPSKDIVKHLMFIIAQQNFSTKIMNPERAGRLIKAVHGIENHVKGKSITMGRIDIYRKLLRQSRTHMLSNTEWVRDLFTDMLSPVSQIRSSAMAFGLEAALLLGTEPQASRAVTELCLREVDDSSTKYAEYFAGRLKQMVRKKQDSSNVPHIWSIVILFLRCRPHQLEKWIFMRLWLEVIQECFNSSDPATKTEANYAWNCLVFAVRPDERTGSNLIKTLSQPLTSQLKRKDIRKLGGNNKARKVTIGSVCNLLYYCLKPSSTAVQLDQYWDAYVAPIVGGTLIPQSPEISPEAAAQDMTDACRILNGLFDSTTPRAWKETRAADSTIMEAKELPALDPKWLRSNATRVFETLTPLIEKLFWTLDSPSSEVSQMWRSYISSVASAGIKEVKVSMDTMTVVANIFNLLYKIWHEGPNNPRFGKVPEGRPSHHFLNSFSSLMLPVIEGLGLLPFTERLLSMGQQDMFVVISTPSQKPPQSRGEMRSPFHHLFVLLSDASTGLQYDSHYLNAVQSLLAPFFEARKSDKSRIELVQDLLQLLPSQPSEACRYIWLVLAEISRSALQKTEESGSGSSSSSYEPLGVHYRNLVKLLDIGIEVSGDEPLPAWYDLFAAVTSSAAAEVGDGGKAIGVIEPLSRILLARISSKGDLARVSGLEYCRTICSVITYPKNRQALEAARRRLWGVPNQGQKGSSADPYNYFYDFACTTLEQTYSSFNSSKVSQYTDLLNTVNKLLDRCPRGNMPGLLMKLQEGLASWVKDERAVVGYSTVLNLSNTITTLWKNICTLIQLTVGDDPSSMLRRIDTLLAAGMESKHRSIVNLTIELWNSTFGNSEAKLEYTQVLVDAIVRLRPITDLLLPDFPKTHELPGSTRPSETVQFVDSQDDTSSFGTNIDSILKKQQTPHLTVSPVHRFRAPSPMDLSSILSPAPNRPSRPRQETPEPLRKRATKQNNTPTLRHNDSQIHFEAIDSSPLAEQAMDSQLLTERQKEVRDRQRADAAMFPDIRSSPSSRPKSASRRQIPSDELQLLRSSASAVRETTPTLAAGDGDDFITSSPTPTRTSTQSDHRDASAPPSSPPEILVTEPVTRSYRSHSSRRSSDIYDIPSSPPERVAPFQSSTSTSPAHSAQIDPYAPINSFKLPTTESSSREANTSTSTVPSLQNGDALNPITSFAEDDEPELPANTAKTNDREEDVDMLDRSDLIETSVSFERPKGLDEPSIVYDTTLMDSPEKVPQSYSTNEEPIVDPAPQTPPRKPMETTNVDQTPNPHLDIFVDALSSPAYSDKQGAEIFVDAVSSPIARQDVAQSKQTPPGASDLDESSLHRLMDRYDQTSARPARRVSRRISQKYGLSSDDLPASTEPTNQDKELPSKPLHGKSTPKKRRVFDKSNNSSQAPSIPETPPKLSEKPTMDDDGETIDYDETIIVDVEGSKYKRATPRKKFLAKLRAAEDSKKRKRVAEADHAEVSESQEASNNDDVEPPHKTRGRRRSRRLGGGSPDLGSGLTAEVPRESSANRAVEPTPRVFPEPRAALVNSRRRVKDKDEPAIQDYSASEMRAESSDAGASTEASRADSSAPPSSPDPEVRNERVRAAAVTRSRSASRRLAEMTSDGPSAADSSPPALRATTAQIVADKLQNIITDLSGGVLTRDELHRLEDLFIDAKEALYKAGKRRRA